MMYDIIIIGAGAAGLTAAIYACRAGKKTLVLEELAFGGQIINTLDIENYPAHRHISGVDFSKNLYAQAEDLGAEVKFEQVEEIQRGENFTVKTGETKYTSGALIFAAGAKSRTLDLPREAQLTGRGVSYCATCDGAFYKGKTVAVNGGGNTAVEDALYLAGVAEKVYLIHRRDAFRADRTLIARLKNFPNIEPVMNSVITNLSGEQKLEGVELKNVQTSAISELKLDGLFVAIGRIPATGLVKNLPGLKLTEGGYIKANENCETGVPGLFAAGDCREKAVRQLVTAAADGCIAATFAARFLDR